jgi:hypothetical protein
VLIGVALLDLSLEILTDEIERGLRFRSVYDAAYLVASLKDNFKRTKIRPLENLRAVHIRKLDRFSSIFSAKF